MSDGLKKAKEYFNKAKPRSKGSAGRESAEKSREKSVKTIARRREKVEELERVRKKNNFVFDADEPDDTIKRVSKLQPGPKDYPEYTYDARAKRMIVPRGFDAYKDTDGGYFRGGTSEPLDSKGFGMSIDYPGLMIRRRSGTNSKK